MSFAKFTPFRILSIEGPAGGGKTTIANRLADEHEFRIADPIMRFPRPRDYSKDGRNGAKFSIMKDFAHFLGALAAWRYDPEKIFIIDRFLWSQYVYGAMRLGRYTPVDVQRGMYASMESLQYITDDYLARSNVDSIGGPEKDRIPVVEIFTLFWMPSPDELVQRRETTDREYPFSPDHEYAGYRRVIRDVASKYAFNYLEDNSVEGTYHLLKAHLLKFFNISPINYPEEGE